MKKINEVVENVENVNTVVENVENVATEVEATSVGEATQEGMSEKKEEEDIPTEAEIKAREILRLRLPELTSRALSFEKRTGSFYRGTMVKQFDNAGAPLYDGNGNQIEKLTRLVVDFTDETGALTEEGVACAAEIEIKRAAGVVLSAPTRGEKLQKDVEVAREALALAEAAVVEFAAEVAEKEGIVMAYDMPEKVVADRVSKTVELASRLSQTEQENARLRAILIAAGIEVE